MPFEKGRVRTGGKIKGTPNKDKREIVAKIQALWDGYSEDQMSRDLSKLSEAERLKIMLGVAAEYLAPKLARSENTQNITVQVQKEAFLIGGKTLYLDGAAPVEIDES